MAKPKFTPESCYAFDASQEHVFEFLWASSNNQSVSNTLTIRNNTTNIIVYSQEQNTLLLKHTLPKDILTNGILYNATISVKDIDGNISGQSDSILFYCYTQPIFNITMEENVIKSSACSVGINYEQAEGEELQVFRIDLYNSSKELLRSSSLKYSTQSSVVFNGLTDNTTYYVKAIAQTLNHMDIETGYYSFTVNYLYPDFYAYVTAENRYSYGDIQFTSNLVSIEGHTDSGNPLYIDNNYIDTVNGTGIKFDANFTIQNNFSIILKGYGFKNKQTILEVSNGDNTLKIMTRIDADGRLYLELNVLGKHTIMIGFSNHLNLNEADMALISVRHKDGYYNILLERDGG